MAKYSGHWYSHPVLMANSDVSAFRPAGEAHQEALYCWVDFGRVRCARLRTLILLSTLLREKYASDLGEEGKLSKDVADKAIRECFRRMPEIDLPDELGRDDQVEDVMQLVAQAVDLIDPEDDIWIDNVLDSVADQVYGIGYGL